jgi:hypothetical protein
MWSRVWWPFSGVVGYCWASSLEYACDAAGEKEGCNNLVVSVIEGPRIDN